MFTCKCLTKIVAPLVYNVTVRVIIFTLSLFSSKFIKQSNVNIQLSIQHK